MKLFRIPKYCARRKNAWSEQSLTTSSKPRGTRRTLLYVPFYEYGARHIAIVIFPLLVEFLIDKQDPNKEKLMNSVAETVKKLSKRKNRSGAERKRARRAQLSATGILSQNSGSKVSSMASVSNSEPVCGAFSRELRGPGTVATNAVGCEQRRRLT